MLPKKQKLSFSLTGWDAETIHTSRNFLKRRYAEIETANINEQLRKRQKQNQKSANPSALNLSILGILSSTLPLFTPLVTSQILNFVLKSYATPRDFSTVEIIKYGLSWLLKIPTNLYIRKKSFQSRQKLLIWLDKHTENLHIPAKTLYIDHYASLDTDLITHILSFVSFSDLLSSIALVNRRWFYLVTSSKFWASMESLVIAENTWENLRYISNTTATNDDSLWGTLIPDCINLKRLVVTSPTVRHLEVFGGIRTENKLQSVHIEQRDVLDDEDRMELEVHVSTFLIPVSQNLTHVFLKDVPVDIQLEKLLLFYHPLLVECVFEKIVLSDFSYISSAEACRHYLSRQIPYANASTAVRRISSNYEIRNGECKIIENRNLKKLVFENCQNISNHLLQLLPMRFPSCESYSLRSSFMLRRSEALTEAQRRLFLPSFSFVTTYNIITHIASSLMLRELDLYNFEGFMKLRITISNTNLLPLGLHRLMRKVALTVKGPRYTHTNVSRNIILPNLEDFETNNMAMFSAVLSRRDVKRALTRVCVDQKYPDYDQVGVEAQPDVVNKEFSKFHMAQLYASPFVDTIRVLEVKNCDSVYNEDFSCLAKVVNLERLSLEGCANITEEVLVGVKEGLPWVFSLVLDRTRVGNDVFKICSERCPSLQDLSLNDTYVTDFSCAQLLESDLPRVWRLQVKDTLISVWGLRCIKNILRRTEIVADEM